MSLNHDELLCLNLYANLVSGLADDSNGSSTGVAATPVPAATPKSSRKLTPEMKKWTGNAVRKSFIDFMVEKQAHKFWPSSPVRV